MFCPKCGKEYEEDIYVCSECGMSLVPELLSDPRNESLELAEFEEILFTPSAGNMAVIKSLLDSMGILLPGRIFQLCASACSTSKAYGPY